MWCKYNHVSILWCSLSSGERSSRGSLLASSTSDKHEGVLWLAVTLGTASPRAVLLWVSVQDQGMDWTWVLWRRLLPGSFPCFWGLTSWIPWLEALLQGVLPGSLLSTPLRVSWAGSHILITLPLLILTPGPTLGPDAGPQLLLQAPLAVLVTLSG